MIEVCQKCANYLLSKIYLTYYLQREITMEQVSIPQLSSGEALEFTFNTLWNNLWLFIKLVVLELLIKIALSFPSRFLHLQSIKSARWVAFADGIFLILAMFVYFGLYLGYAKVSFKLYDTGSARVRDYFLQLGTIIRCFLGTCLFLVLTILGFLLIVPGVFIYLNYFFFDFFIIDQSMTIRQSFAASKQLVYGSRLRLAFYTYISFFVFCGFCLITLFLGVFFVWPFYMLARVSLYRQLLARQAKRQEIIA